SRSRAAAPAVAEEREQRAVKDVAPEEEISDEELAKALEEGEEGLADWQRRLLSLKDEVEGEDE
ncbi:MAG TPA: hypothetical protein VNL15_03755, partial [Dehalococcoidia bacterium]|nr:hypothetical protein [Dehalococcoidia bacterium]